MLEDRVYGPSSVRSQVSDRGTGGGSRLVSDCIWKLSSSDSLGVWQVHNLARMLW